MKEEDTNIDELLNSFIDGELTARQQTEVQRLIKHDVQIARRLLELQKCKTLIGSLPRAKAPAEMAEEIKASLERRTLLGRLQPERFYQREGARHLLVRKVAAAAAMIGLVAVLGAVIYTIVAPPKSGTEWPIAVEDWPDRKVKTAERPIDRADAAAMKFCGRLELKTSELVSVDAFIGRVIEDNDLLDCIRPGSQRDKSVYTLGCSREALGLLLADLEVVWARFDSATLFVETNRFGEQVVVDAVTAEQIAEVVNQDSFETRIEVAKDFAVLNNLASLSPGREVFAAIDDARGDLMTILPPKPRLTGGPEKTIKKPAGRAKDEVQVRLTIVVAGVNK